jgi:beta-lactamase regulating signal transducer with metallopeptidase domain
MMAAGMAFSLAVAAFLSAAAHALDRTAGLCRLPRRGVWAMALLSSWILPLAMIVHANRAPVGAPASVRPALAQASMVQTDARSTTQRVASVVFAPRWPAQPELDETLMAAWGSISCGLLMVWGATAFRLYRRSKGWPVARIDGVAVSITDAFGPAVFGYLRPRIVMTNAVLAQPERVRSIALKHEQSHIAARDPTLLLVALVLVFLAPWNMALWWQLRRLRFAIEVDCDARVLKDGVGPAAYGETLLSISQKSVPAPLGMAALTEPTSQLEKRIRIMMTGPVRYRKVLMGFSLVIAASLVLAATGLSAPAGDSSMALRKPPPGHDGAVPEKFAALIKDRYPSLATQASGGTPVVTVLFNHDGTVARTDMEIFQGSPRDFKASAAQFGRFGLTPDTVGYVGEQGLDFGTNVILVVYTERGAQHFPFTSNLFPNSRMIDRALAERFFPTAVERGVPAGEGIWVLFDRDGAVLRTGQESFDPDKLTHILESRYPGIKASDMTVTPVVDANMQPVKTASGGELHLHSVWLDVGSPLPGA